MTYTDPNPSADSVGLVERDARTMSDPQRMLWRDDVEGVCPSVDSCFEYSKHVRCGPCAVKQADEHGVATDHGVPNLPEVYRLRRSITTQAAEIARLREALAWYAEQTAGCRKVTSEGNEARYALDEDGGKRARQALSKQETSE